MQSANFVVDLFGSSSGRVFLATLPNPELKGTPEGEPDERHIWTRSREQIGAFVTKWNRPGRAVYLAVSTFQRDATSRCKDTVQELIALHADIDFRGTVETPEEILRIVEQLAPPPSLVIHSGHGLHLYWVFNEPIPATAESKAEHDRLLRQLADHLGADTAVAHCAALMRLPGTTNSKNGDALPVHVIVERPNRYALEELKAWLATAAPVIHRKGGNGASPDNPFLAFARALGIGETPLNAEHLLADMVYLGPGGGGNAHDTLLRAMASMARRGVPAEDAIARGLKALTDAAARSGISFDPVKETAAIAEMYRSGAEKFQRETESETKTEAEDETETEAKTEAEPFKPLATVYVFPDPATIPPREFLFGKHYVRNFVTATIAPGVTGKSSRSLAEIIAMVTDTAFLGERPRNGPLRAWYYGEDPKPELDRRIAAICQHYGIRQDAIGDRLCIDSIHNLRLKELAIVKPVKSGIKVIFNESLIRDLIETFHALKLDVAIFDPLITLHSVPENDPASMDAVVRQFGMIAEQVHAAIDLVHHTRKPASGQAEITVEDARGARAIIDAARGSRILNPMSPKEAEAADVEPDERWRYFRTNTGKVNVSPPEVAAWNELISVIIANSDNVGVVAPWDFPSALDMVTPEDVRWIRELVRAEPDHAYHSNAKTWIGIPLAARLRLDPEDRADRTKLRKILKTWLGNGVIELDRRIIPNQRHGCDFVKPGKRPAEPENEET
jgi:hypothetical protein